MAMNKCKECGEEVTHIAAVCFHCGVSNPTNKVKEITGILSVLAIFLLISIVIFSSSDDDLISSDEYLIPYKILNQSELAHHKVSFDVEVPLINGRLPTESELGDLSNYLVGKTSKHTRSFVVFYLPNMILDAGAFATAHHNPVMKVEILDFMLLYYPEYTKFYKK